MNPFEIITTYDEKKNPVMTTLFFWKGRSRTVVFACDGWKNLNDMVTLGISLNKLKRIS